MAQEKKGTLKEKFAYYKRRMYERLIEEQAYKEARGLGALEGRIKTLFKNLDYEEIMTKGFTRKKGSHTVRITGEEAVKIQIKGLQQRSSKIYQKNLFIRNYVKALESRGLFNDTELVEIEKILRKATADKLAYLIDTNILPQIPDIYAGELGDSKSFINNLKNAVEKGISQEEFKKLKERAKKLIPLIREKNKITG